MHPNEKLLTRFYTSFSERDAGAMWACYGPDARFSDGIFQDLRGEQVRAMWEMLCKDGKDLVVTSSDIWADEHTGRAHWTASYTFSGTGRSVRNSVRASFCFVDGLISEHRDSFSVWRWMSKALGWQGAAVGWAPPARARVRDRAAKSLDVYLSRQSARGVHAAPSPPLPPPPPASAGEVREPETPGPPSNPARDRDRQG